MLNVHKILIDNDSPHLEISNFILDQKAKDEFNLQCIIKNTAKINYQVRTIELRLYDLNSKFMGYKTFFLDEQVIRPNDDMAIEFFLENLEKYGHASLKVRSVRWLNSEKAIGYIVAIAAVALIGLKLMDFIS